MAEKTFNYDPDFELLAPAGSMACALTAFDAGADAVYAGLPKFNARERTENLSFQDLSKLTCYARKYRKKVYLTLNTLLKETELTEVAELLSEVSRISPNAIIIQDFGVLRLIREYFPEFEIHASTQMGLHNLPGIELAAERGIKRVILERQMPLEEIREIAGKSPLPLEVFIHGALCCSLSGRCLLSSWLGGWSGNRGKCKQPCRRRYFSDSGNGFFLSPNDLSALEFLPDLKKMGVKSGKIEGRLRNAGYVWHVVKAYRMVLDAKDSELPEVMPKAREVLSHALGRKWSSGFFDPKGLKNVIQHRGMGASGLLCGEVMNIQKNGVYVRVSRPLRMGDRVRIQPVTGDEGPAFTITRMLVDGKVVKVAKPKQICFLPCDKEIPAKSMVFKIGITFDGLTERIARMPGSRIPLDMEQVFDGAEISVKLPDANLAWTKKFTASPAQNRPLTPEKLIKEFSSGGSENFRAGKISAEVSGEWFVPAGELKQTRREFWDWTEEQLNPESPPTHSGLAKFFSDYRSFQPERGKMETTVVLPAGKKPSFKTDIAARHLKDFRNDADEVILPFFVPQGQVEKARSRIKEVYLSGIRRFRVTSPSGLALVKEFPDVTLVAGFPLPVCNSLAVREIAGLGVSKALAWVELDKPALSALLEKSSLPLEIFRKGRISLLVTRAKVPVSGKISDGRSLEFDVVEDRASGLTLVYSTQNLELPEVSGTSGFFDLTNIDFRSKDISSFNLDYEWK